MLSSTASDATQRVFLDRSAAVGGSRRGLVDARALSEGFCSPAGLHRRPWLEGLRRALGGGLFVLHFQPIVALSDRRVSHHEALLRLADEPDGRLGGPGRFLAAAERYWVVSDIDRMVIDEVAALLSAGADERARIAVNLSALSVTDATMLAYI